MKYILAILLSFGLVVSGFSQTRNVVVDTNGVVVQPTNIWTANATNARSGLGLGTAATNPASAFQPSSSVLSNLASSNGVNLTNIPAAGVVGALATNGSGAGLTNITAANITGTVALASNVTGTIAISNGGTGATNAATARTNLGLGATNNAFISLSVGANNTNLSSDNSSAFGTQNFIDSSAEESFAFGGANKITNMPSGSGGSIVMGLLGNMTHQGAFLFNGVPQGGTIGNSRGDNTFAVNASNGIFLNGPVRLEGVSTVGSGLLAIGSGGVVSKVITNTTTAQVSFFGWDGFVNTAFTTAQARTNLGLAWSALTNSNAGTGLVSVNTNGEVVSPTNFWQVAPINTRVQLSQPVVNATNAATNARNLYLYSLAISTTGVTNTITLPTNSLVFLGDVATVIHDGPTSSVTAIRQIGSATNLITLNQVREAVKFIYESDGWRLADNISYVEPIYFSGTSASANAAASRTNLGLGSTNNVEFQEIKADSIVLPKTGAPLVSIQTGGGSLNVSMGGLVISPSPQTVSIANGYRLQIGTGSTLTFADSSSSLSNVPTINFLSATNAAQTRTNLGLGATNNVTFSNIIVGSFDSGSDTGFVARNSDGTLRLRGTNVTTSVPAFFGWNGNESTAMSAEISRTNLGLGWPALTNTSNTTFQEAIFTTNAAPTNAGNFGDHVAWMGVSIVTNGVTNVFKIPLYK